MIILRRKASNDEIELMKGEFIILEMMIFSRSGKCVFLSLIYLQKINYLNGEESGKAKLKEIKQREMHSLHGKIFNF